MIRSVYSQLYGGTGQTIDQTANTIRARLSYDAHRRNVGTEDALSV